METIVRVQDGVAAEIIRFQPVELIDETVVVDEIEVPETRVIKEEATDDDGAPVIVERTETVLIRKSVPRTVRTPRQSTLVDHYPASFIDTLVVYDGPVEPGWLLTGETFSPPPGPALDDIKADALADIDNIGVATRTRVIGPKETVYLAKVELAVRSENGDATATALLQPEATARGMTVDALCDVIMAARSLRLQQMMQMETASAVAKAAISTASTSDGVRSAVSAFATAMEGIGA